MKYGCWWISLDTVMTYKTVEANLETWQKESSGELNCRYQDIIILFKLLSFQQRGLTSQFGKYLPAEL